MALGQIEAARAIGMSEPAIVRRILMPLGLVSALPALVNFSIILTKETVILSIITVPELMYQVQRMSTETFRYLEANLVLALFFWGLVEVVSRVGRRLEATLTRHLIESRRMVQASSVEIRGVSKFYGPFQALKEVSLIDPAGQGDLPDRAFRFRQVDAAALHQLPRGIRFRRDHASTGELIGYDAPAAARCPAASCAQCAARSAWCSSSSTCGRT